MLSLSWTLWLGGLWGIVSWLPQKSRTTLRFFIFLTVLGFFVVCMLFFAVLGLSLVVHRGFSCCGTRALDRMGSVAVVLGLSFPMACGILVPQPGIKPTTPALEGGFLNHWTTREVPTLRFLTWSAERMSAFMNCGSLQEKLIWRGITKVWF